MSATLADEPTEETILPEFREVPPAPPREAGDAGPRSRVSSMRPPPSPASAQLARDLLAAVQRDFGTRPPPPPPPDAAQAAWSLLAQVQRDFGSAPPAPPVIETEPAPPIWAEESGVQPKGSSDAFQAFEASPAAAPVNEMDALEEADAFAPAPTRWLRKLKACMGK